MHAVATEAAATAAASSTATCSLAIQEGIAIHSLTSSGDPVRLFAVVSRNRWDLHAMHHGGLVTYEHGTVVGLHMPRTQGSVVEYVSEEGG